MTAKERTPMFQGLKGLADSKKSSVAVPVIAGLGAMIQQELLSPRDGAILIVIVTVGYLISQGWPT